MTYTYCCVYSRQSANLYDICLLLCIQQAVSKPVWHIPIAVYTASSQQTCMTHTCCCVYSKQSANLYDICLLLCIQQAVSKPVWHTPTAVYTVLDPDDGQRNCPKHVQFYSKNKFEKLVHLLGCIIRTVTQLFVSRSRINKSALLLTNRNHAKHTCYLS